MAGIIPKTIQKSPLWQDILLYFSIGLFLAAIFSFFAISKSQKKAENSLQKLDEALAQKKTAEEISREKEIKIIEKQVNDFSQIFDAHVYSSKIFDVFPKIIHPKARFKQVNFDVVKSEVNISGETESLTTLQQQIFIFQKEQSLIKDFIFNSFNIGEKGKINFSFKLFLTPQLFK